MLVSSDLHNITFSTRQPVNDFLTCRMAAIPVHYLYGGGGGYWWHHIFNHNYIKTRGKHKILHISQINIKYKQQKKKKKKKKKKRGKQNIGNKIGRHAMCNKFVKPTNVKCTNLGAWLYIEMGLIHLQLHRSHASIQMRWETITPVTDTPVTDTPVTDLPVSRALWWLQRLLITCIFFQAELTSCAKLECIFVPTDIPLH